MGRDTIFRNAVHLKSPDLDLQRLPVAIQHRSMQRLVHIRLRYSNIILKAPRYRTPHAVHNAQSAVAVLNAVYQHTDRQQIINLTQFLMVAQHLFMDTVKILGPPLDLARNIHRIKMLFDLTHSRMDHCLTLAAFDLDLLDQIIIDLRLHITERQILQLPLNGINTQTVSQRRIDLHRFARNRLLLMHRHKFHRPHIMQPVGQFYHNYADILGHRQKHLTVVFDLLLFLGNILDLA